MTTSEQLFEEFCRTGSIHCCRLEPDGDKTPDYEITIGDQRIVVEIKELTPNDEEKQAIRDMKREEFTSWGSDKIGNRIRYKIDDAKRQLEPSAANKYPSILVLYDARPIPIKGISPYEIEVAMYGWETIDVHVSANLSKPVHFGKHRFGKGKKFRRDCHAYISALGVLREVNPDGRLHLSLYHNIFARSPIRFEFLAIRNDITVYTVAPGKGNEFRGWARVVVAEEKYKDCIRCLKDELALALKK